MKKTQSDKKLSIDVVTVRKLDSDLSVEQLRLARGGIWMQSDHCTTATGSATSRVGGC